MFTVATVVAAAVVATTTCIDTVFFPPPSLSFLHRSKRLTRVFEHMRNRYQVKMKMDQSTKFLLRQRNTLETGYTLENLWAFAQKYALALLLGIFIALVWSNVDDASYQRFCGPAHHGAALTNDTNSSAAHRMLLSSSSATGSGSSCPAPKPTILGLSFHGHDVTLNFLVNDVLMTLFFGLAVKEITEAFEKGGSLHPMSKAINPLIGTCTARTLYCCGGWQCWLFCVELGNVSLLFTVGCALR